MPEPIPDVIVELLVLGELEDHEAAEVRARLEADGDPRLEEIEQSNAEVLARYPVHEVVAELMDDLGAGGSPWPRDTAPVRRVRPVVIVAAVGLAVAASVALIWGLGSSSDPVARPEPEQVAVVEPLPALAGDGVRHKGAQRLVIDRRGQEASLGPGDVVEPGDVLQLSYSKGGRRYGVIVSLDGAGVATLHWPERAEDSTELGPGLVRLEYAYELDDAPDFERFFFVAADEPISVSEVIAAATALGSTPDPKSAELGGPAGWTSVSLLLLKRSGPR